MMRWLFAGLGMVFLGLGILGAILPVLPTTPFVLLAAMCFSKGSRRCHQWLVQHCIFGKILHDWEENRAIPRFGKIMSLSMMTISCAMLFYRLPDYQIWIACLTSVICAITAIWIVRLPTAKPMS